MVPAADAERVWNALMGDASSVVPCGLGARDTLRLEAAMPLYGHEIDESTNPYEARLGWAVNVGKTDFVGRDALVKIKAQGASRKLVGLQVPEGGVPRQGAPILQGGSSVGMVTSGTHSPTLRTGIALGYVPQQHAAVGEDLAIELRGKALPASVVSLPFVPHRTRRRPSTP
jgi:aminomethyltransferase